MSDLLEVLNQRRQFHAKEAAERLQAGLGIMSPAEEALIASEIRGALAAYSSEMVLFLSGEEPDADAFTDGAGGMPALPVSTGMDLQENGDNVTLRRKERSGAEPSPPPTN